MRFSLLRNYSVLTVLLVGTLVCMAADNRMKFRVAYNEGRYEDALALLPETPDAAPAKCRILLKMNQEANALAFAESILKNTNTSVQIGNALLETLVHEVDPEICKKIANDYKTRTTNNSNTEVICALINYKLGDASAFRTLAKDFEARKIESEYFGDIAFQEVILPLYHKQEYKKALLGFEDIYVAAPQKRADPNFSIERAMIYLDSKQYLECLQVLDETEALLGKSNLYDDDKKAKIAKGKGDAYVQLNDYTNAIQQYAAVQQLAASGCQIAELFMDAITNRSEIIKDRMALLQSSKPVVNNEKKYKHFRIFFACFIVLNIGLLYLLISKLKAGKKIASVIVLMAGIFHAKAGETNLTVTLGRFSVASNVICNVNIPIESDSVVKKINSSCGCTVPQLSVGDVIRKEQPLTITVSIGESSSIGKVLRSVQIDTTTGLTYSIDITYEWMPKPFSLPTALVFSSVYQTRECALNFPEERDVKYLDLESPLIGFKVGKANYSNKTILLSITPNTNLEKGKIGKLRFKTTSTNLPTMEVPYLIVR